MLVNEPGSAARTEREQSPLPYRADIDGIRGLAVLSVVLFHAQLLPGRGGFVGVDAFFVVSGWVITSLIVRQADRGTFSLALFYERRIRRLFPALSLVLVACSAIGLLILLPRDLEELGSSTIAASLFASNFFFWMKAGYFDSATEMKPLVHTWTLSVEEQYYLVFPVLLLLVHRLGRKRMVAAVEIAAAASFCASVWGVANYPFATFYLAPTRAWELLLGSLAALGVFPAARGRLASEGAGLVGLALFLYSALAFSGATTFPGTNALFPCVGALLMIQAGSGDGGLFTRALSARPLVYIGSISYAIYLWHWPLLVLARYHEIFELSYGKRASVVLAAVVFAGLSGRFLEHPFRARSSKPGRDRTRFFVVAGACAALACLLGWALRLDGGWSRRFTAEVNAIASASPDRKVLACRSEEDKGFPLGPACTFGKAVEPRVAVWGDSHAEALIHGIAREAEMHEQSVVYFGSPGCRPVLGVFDARKSGRFCTTFNDGVLEYLRSHDDVKSVILIGRLVTLAHGKTRKQGPADGDEPPTISDSPGHVLEVDAAEALTRTALRETVKRLTDLGKLVVLVYPIPETGYPIPSVGARLVARHRDVESFTTSVSTYVERSRFVFEVLDGIKGPNISRVYPHQRLCGEHTCTVFADGKPLYLDGDHLSPAGAERVGPIFAPVFR